MKSLSHIFWLGTKELRAVMNDTTMVFLIIFVFTFMVYLQTNAMPENVNNASIAIVDEDHSALSRQLANAFYPPFFQTPTEISIDELDPGLDQNRFLFAIVIPPSFEQKLRKGTRTEIQLHIDATAVLQAGLGDGYIQNIIQTEVARYLSRQDQTVTLPAELIIRRAFNPNGTQSWFSALTSLLDFISIIAIMLTGAALIREREHGTIEHLLVMPLNAFEIAMAKIWANSLVILVAFTLSLIFVVEGLLDVPIAGSRLLLIAGSALYLFAAAAIGIFLGTIARTMAQFSLLVIMVIFAIILLSGGMSPIESQPEIIQPLTWLLPSRHYMAFAQAVVFRAANISIVWPQLLTIAGLGSVFLFASLALFRRSIS